MAETLLVSPETLGILYVRFPRLPEEKFQRMCYNTQITVRENTLIHALETLHGIERLSKDLKPYQLEELKQQFKVFYTWEKTSPEEYNKAMDHLRHVNDFHNKHFGRDYEHAWLLTWEETFCERVRNKYKKSKDDNIEKFKI